MRFRFVSIVVMIFLVTAVSQTSATNIRNSPNVDDIPWQPGIFEIRVFDVEQGDSQLIIFPSGYTILIDVAEPSYNSSQGAMLIAEKIRAITGGSHVNVGVLSHLHFDHIGYVGFGGFWGLLEDENITFDKIIDRDAGVWIDSLNSELEPDGVCDPESEISWHNAGDISGTAKNWVCYATNSANSKIYPIREVAQVGSIDQIDPPDINAQVEIIQVNAAQVIQTDGITPVAGDHTQDSKPPNENDYSIVLKISYEEIDYITGGDIGGEYHTSFDSTYNDVETVIAPWIGRVEILRVNHHGSGYSTNQTYVDTLSPETTLISCGANTYGHPHQTVLDRLTAVSGVYITNYCTDDSDYSDATIVDGDIIIRSNNGLTYTINEPYSIQYLPLIVSEIDVLH